MKLRKHQIAYKVVRPMGIVFQSAILNTNRVSVRYDIGKMAVPPHAHQNQFLFAFDTAAHARKFRDNLGMTHVYNILKGIAINPKLSARSYNHKLKLASDCPKGTLFCDAFVPVEQIK